MFTTIKGIYEQGRVILKETPPTSETVEVLITFTEKVQSAVSPAKKLIFGYGKGTFSYMSPDFNEPLDDLKDYM